MPQNVPEFRFGDDALRVRQFLYEHWCAHGHAPNLRAVHAATGLSRESVIARDGETLAHTPASLLVHVSTSPREWNLPDIVAMCDSMNFVLDEAHAARYDAVLGRRGVRFTMEQARRFVTPTGKARMWQYDRAPDYIRPEKIIAGIRALGVDTTAWET